MFRDDADSAPIEEFAAYVKSTAKLNAQERIDIYRGSIFGNVSEALAISYPVTVKVIGEQNFRYIASRYIERYPSLHQNLNHYGDKMAELTASLPELQDNLKVLPYLPDLMRLEWEHEQTFYAANDSALDLAALGAVSPENQEKIIFKLSNSAKLFTSQHNVFEIWKQHVEAAADAAAPLQGDGDRLLVWRRVYEQRVDPLTALEWDFLQLLSQGRSLGEIFESFGDRQAELAQLLPQCMQRGWFVDFKLQSEPSPEAH